MCYKAEETAYPITDLKIVEGKDAPAPSGYSKIDIDLNEKAGGKYLYLCYTKDPKHNPPTKHIQIIKGKDADAPAGYVKIPTDLNASAGGDYLYLCYLK